MGAVVSNRMQFHSTILQNPYSISDQKGKCSRQRKANQNKRGTQNYFTSKHKENEWYN